jgi:CheY-like chemotaxis protein
MKLEKILIINDDSEDIVSMQKRLPANIQVYGASQAEARHYLSLSGYDLIILDNDANNLNESKGAETVSKIRKNDSKVPIIFTSFQPVMVPESVFKTKGVNVVKTDQALEYLSKVHGIELSNEEFKSNSTEPQLNIIMTYNQVKGYSAGMHSDKLLIISYDKHAGTRAKEIATKELIDIYQTFDWRTDRDKIRNVFVYDGINGGDRPGFSAASLGHDIRMKINVLACSCDWGRKQRFKDSTYVDLYQVGCGGQTELGMISDVILGLERPDRDYNSLSIPKEKILGVTERFKI